PRTPIEANRTSLPQQIPAAGCSYAEIRICILDLNSIAQVQARPAAPRMTKIHTAKPIVVDLRLGRCYRRIQSLVPCVARSYSTSKRFRELTVKGTGRLVGYCAWQDTGPAR